RREAGGAGLGVDEVDVAVFRAEETGAAADARVADHHVGGHGVAGGAAFVRDDGADRRVDGAAADGAAGVDEVSGEGVFDAEAVIDRADGGDVLGEARGLREIFGVGDTGDGGVDDAVVGAGGAGFRAA